MLLCLLLWSGLLCRGLLLKQRASKHNTPPTQSPNRHTWTTQTHTHRKWGRICALQRAIITVRQITELQQHVLTTVNNTFNKWNRNNTAATLVVYFSTASSNHQTPQTNPHVLLSFNNRWGCATLDFQTEEWIRAVVLAQLKAKIRGIIRRCYLNGQTPRSITTWHAAHKQQSSLQEIIVSSK